MSLRHVLFAICLSSFSFTAFALTDISLALDWYINPDHAPILAAETQGFFAENGLHVSLIQPTQNSEARNLVVSGQATIGIDYEPEALMAISKGLPIEMVGTLVPTPLSCIAVLQSTKIKSLKDLKGGSIGYSGDPMEQAFLQVELKHAGLNPTDVKLVPIQMDLTQALLSDTVDAVNGMMRNVEPIMLQQMGAETKLFYPEKNGIPTYSELVFITHTGTNPQTIAAFLKAVGEGARYVKDHPTASWQAAQKAYPTELASSNTINAQNEAIWLASVPYFTSSPQDLDARHTKTFKAFLQKEGLIAN